MHHPACGYGAVLAPDFKCSDDTFVVRGANKADYQQIDASRVQLWLFGCAGYWRGAQSNADMRLQGTAKAQAQQHLIVAVHCTNSARRVGKQLRVGISGVWVKHTKSGSTYPHRQACSCLDPTLNIVNIPRLGERCTARRFPPFHGLDVC